MTRLISSGFSAKTKGVPPCIIATRAFFILASRYCEYLGGVIMSSVPLTANRGKPISPSLSIISNLSQARRSFNITGRPFSSIRLAMISASSGSIRLKVLSVRACVLPEAAMAFSRPSRNMGWTRSRPPLPTQISPLTFSGYFRPYRSAIPPPSEWPVMTRSVYPFPVTYLPFLQSTI